MTSLSSTGKRTLVLTLAMALLVTVLPGVGYAAPAAPTLRSPEEGAAVATNPVLEWSGVATASAYRVQVSASPTFGSFLYNVETANTRATPPADLPTGTLYWRVAAVDGRVTGPFTVSSFRKETTAAPAPLSPTDGAVLTFPDDPPTFVWEPVPGATGYRLEVDDGADFIGADVYTTAATSYTLTEPQPTDQPFYWRVQATMANRTNSAWSTTRSYEVQWPMRPTLVSPPNRTSPAIQDVELRWEPVPGAATYQVQISPNGDWANNVVVDEVVKGTRYSPNPPPAQRILNNGSYFWRVRARDARNWTANLGGWSAVWTFSRDWPDRPVLLSPPNDGAAPVSDPTLRWEPVPHASHYEVQVSTDVNFPPATSVTASCFTNQTTFTPYARVFPLGQVGEPGICGVGYTTSLRFTPGTTYYWRVRGVDAPLPIHGLWSNTGTSDTWRFVYRPAIPELRSLTSGETVHTPVLSWSAVPGHGKYRVTIVRASGSTVTADTHALSYTPTARLRPQDGPFHWYVQTIDAGGRLGLIPSSAQWGRFSVVEPPEPPTGAALAPLTPTAGAELAAARTPSTRMPSMTWVPLPEADHYRVYTGVTGSGVVETLSGNTRLYQAGFTYAGTTNEAGLPPGAYTWYVEAFTSGGASLGTGPTGTFTIEPHGAVQQLSPAHCPPDAQCAPVKHTPTLEWEAVEPGADAGGYLVYVATDPNFTNEYRRYWTTHTQLTPRESYLDNQAGQAYYWYVRPCAHGQNPPCGPFNTEDHARASAFHKRSEAANTQTPAAAATVADLPTFTWEEYLDTNLRHGSSQGALQYRIQVSTVSDFASLIDEKTVDQRTFTPFDRTYPEGPLHWRVQAIDGSGNRLTWSPRRQLTKASPRVTLSSPSHESTVTGVPSLRWQPQSFAAQYEVEVYRDGDLNFSPTNRVVRATTKMTSSTPDRALGGGSYAWRVRRLDADGRPGPWSNGRLFTLAPDGPALLAPADGVTATAPPLFEWRAVPEAASYRFEASTSATFGTFVEQQTTAMTAWAPTRLWRSGQHHWRVRALDSAGNTLATSSTRAVVIDDSSAPGGGTGPDVSGTDRRLAAATNPVQASVDLSRASFLDGTAEHVAIGRDDVFADSLAGAALAGTSGPILYTTGGPDARLRAEVLREAQRVLGPAKGCGSGPEVFLLGGTNAVSAHVEQTFTGLGYCAKRYAGASRVETSVQIATDVVQRNGSREVLLARADLWADAATGGAYAAAAGSPIIVTQASSLHPAARSFLGTVRPSQAVLLGGDAALSPAVEQAVRPYASTRRVAGAARDMTAVAIARDLWSRHQPTGVVLVNGYGENSWTYALAAAVPAAREQAVQLYVQRDAVSSGTRNYLADYRYTFTIAVGPTSVISDSVYHEVRSGADRVT